MWSCCYTVFHAARVLQATDCTSYTDKSLSLLGTVGWLFQVPTLTNQFCPFVEYIGGGVMIEDFKFLLNTQVALSRLSSFCV